VLVDQFVDRTHKRESSFFGKGCVAHVSMAHPVSPRLHAHLAAAAEAEGIAIARGGTYVCMEGPQFSSYAESMTYKKPRLFGDRHDQYAGGQARPRGRDLLRDRGDGDRFRLLASRPRRRNGAGHHPGADFEPADRAKGLVARLAKDLPREHEPCPIGSDRTLDTALITAPEARDPDLLKKLDAVAGRILRM